MHRELHFSSEGIPLPFEENYDQEWLSYPGKDLLSKHNFENRKYIIDNSLDLETETYFEKACDLEKWSNIDYMEEGECIRISNINLKKYIDPYSSYEFAQNRKTSHYTQYIVLAGLLSSFLPRDKRVVFTQDGTLLTNNFRKLNSKEVTSCKHRIIRDCLDFSSVDLKKESRFYYPNNLQAWFSIDEIERGEYLRVSEADLRKLIEPSSVANLIKNKNKVHPYQEYVTLAGILGSFLPEDKRLVFASNFADSGTYITKK